ANPLLHSSSSILSFSRPPATPEILTLSLHDALPISQHTSDYAYNIKNPLYSILKRLSLNTKIIAYSDNRLNNESQLVASGLSERSEEHTSELQSRENLVCRLLLEKTKAA